MYFLVFFLVKYFFDYFFFKKIWQIYISIEILKKCNLSKETICRLGLKRCGIYIYIYIYACTQIHILTSLNFEISFKIKTNTWIYKRAEKVEKGNSIINCSWCPWNVDKNLRPGIENQRDN